MQGSEGAHAPETPGLQADDLELVRSAARGNGRAFHELVDRHAPRLYRMAVALCGNAADAEDVLQEAFTGAYRGLGRFEARSSVKTWLSRILVTQAALWRRRRGSRRDVLPLTSLGGAEAEGGELPVAAPGVGPAAEVDYRVDLRAALQALSPDHREVVTLREIDGLSYEEIARALGVPRGTVESRLHRARAELRERLKAYRPDARASRDDREPDHEPL
jgi:RNA polymerase sigma-70 factor (ECF subfamily)